MLVGSNLPNVSGVKMSNSFFVLKLKLNRFFFYSVWTYHQVLGSSAHLIGPSERPLPHKTLQGPPRSGRGEAAFMCGLIADGKQVNVEQVELITEPKPAGGGGGVASRTHVSTEYPSVRPRVSFGKNAANQNINKAKSIHGLRAETLHVCAANDAGKGRKRLHLLREFTAFFAD